MQLGFATQCYSLSSRVAKYFLGIMLSEKLWSHWNENMNPFLGKQIRDTAYSAQAEVFNTISFQTKTAARCKQFWTGGSAAVSPDKTWKDDEYSEHIMWNSSHYCLRYSDLSQFWIKGNVHDGTRVKARGSQK